MMKQPMIVVSAIAGLIWVFSDAPSERGQEKVALDQAGPGTASVPLPPAGSGPIAATPPETAYRVENAPASTPGGPEHLGPNGGRLGAPKNASMVQHSPRDTRPLPPIPSDRDRDILTRVIGEHFRSHPTTERRIWNLRQLAATERGEPIAAAPQHNSSMDSIDTAVMIKNEAALFGARLFSKVAGPLSLQEEWEVGQEVHRQLLEDFVVNEKASRRVERLADPLLKMVRRTRGRRYTFTVVDDHKVNAFAHLGGHIYVFQGLLDLVTTDQQLQFVLAHEIAHVEQQHCASLSLPGVIAQRRLGKLAELPASLASKMVGLSYSPENELESDAWAYHTLRKLGFTESGIADFFYRLMQHEQQLKQAKS